MGESIISPYNRSATLADLFAPNKPENGDPPRWRLTIDHKSVMVSSYCGEANIGGKTTKTAK